jgi:glycosyltransferase involved in cell wall biosynthesis
MNISNTQNEMVGIILCTYNPNHTFLMEQLRSIQDQDFTNWVCLVLDDHSDQRLLNEASEFLKADKRFIYLSNESTLGYYRNYEKGLKYYTQRQDITHVAFCDQDDVWMKRKLTSLLLAMKSECVVLAHSDMELIDENGSQVGVSLWEKEKRRPEGLSSNLLLVKNVITGCSMMMRSDFISNVLPFPSLDGVTEPGEGWDHDHWIAVVSACLGTIVHIREPLTKYRQHQSNLLGASDYKGTLREELRLWCSKNDRFTLKSYPRMLRMSDSLWAHVNALPLAAEPDRVFTPKFDLGLSVLRLGLHGMASNYSGIQGIICRLYVNKLLIDVQYVKSKICRLFSSS